MVRGLVPAETVLSHERTLPVDPALESVVPTGHLQRGSTIAVHGIGATSFALATVGQAVRDGAFLAIVAPESFGLAACLDFDIPLRRVVQFVLGAGPNSVPNQSWAQAVASILEGFDLVILADRRRVGSSQARQLLARNRERGSVMMRVGGPSWPDAADMRFDVSAPEWSGLGQGHGYLQERRVTVQVAGRRHHGRQRAHQVLLPSAAGGVSRAPAVTPVVTPLRARTSQPEQVEEAAQVGQAASRFAGSDIDAMLDAVDQASTESEQEGGTVVDLNATA